MNRWYMIMSLLIVMLLATSCFAISPTSPPTGELEIVSHGMTGGDSGKVEVQVMVKNVGSSTIGVAQVKVNFYDFQGNLISSSSDTVMNLRASENWSFEIACPGAGFNQVKNYEIEAMAATSSGGL